MDGDQSPENKDQSPENKDQSPDSKHPTVEDTDIGEMPQCKMGKRNVDDMRFMITCTNWY
ncbi:unnamed protein product [Knipowitschia caucasica]